jgi:nitrate reductase gamma subunit
MEQWLTFARGPLFIAAFSLMVLGLGRVAFMQLWEMGKSWPRMEDHRLPWWKNLKELVAWSFPVTKISRAKPVIGVVSFFFHVALIATPLLLAEHVVLWRRALGFGWPSLTRELADALTLIFMVAVLLLLGIRIFHRPSRALSGFWDYALLLILLLPFVSGYAAMHPEFLIFRIKTMLLIHVLSGELVFVLIPFSKLSHLALFPFGRLSSDFYWRLPADGPDRVARALHSGEVKA